LNFPCEKLRIDKKNFLLFDCHNPFMTMKNKIDIFDTYAKEYDKWFDTYLSVYQSELRAVKMLLPHGGRGIEIGVGTGRFSVPFGITVGVEPSRGMAEIARSRGITVSFFSCIPHLVFQGHSPGAAFYR
jgi:ubiquinone/menaquinone biosynthesis C-methylase UbiE